MVNVDISPSVVLGVGLLGAGVSLLQLRRVKPWISKDYDVVVSSICLLVGGILIFQGWRLDPLLLFGQLLTTGAAVSFAIEALKLRSEQYESTEKAALQDAFKRKGPGSVSGGAAFQLPPAEQPAAQPWGEPPPQAWQQQQQQQQGTEFYDYQQLPKDNYDLQQYQQQQQQGHQQYGGAVDGQWYYGSGQYQVADYEAPPPAGTADTAGLDGAFYSSSRGRAGGAPSEFVFPASYGEDATARLAPSTEGSSSSCGDYGETGQQEDQEEQGQGQQWGQQLLGPGRSSGYEMDDW